MFTKDDSIWVILMFCIWLGFFLFKSLPYMIYQNISLRIKRRALAQWNLRHVHPPRTLFFSNRCSTCIGTKSGPVFHKIQSTCDICNGLGYLSD